MEQSHEDLQENLQLLYSKYFEIAREFDALLPCDSNFNTPVKSPSNTSSNSLLSPKTTEMLDKFLSYLESVQNEPLIYESQSYTFYDEIL